MIPLTCAVSLHNKTVLLQSETKNEPKITKTNQKYMANKQPNVDFIWNILNNVLHLTFKRNELGDVLFPFIVLRRMDCLLEPYNDTVNKAYLLYKDRLSTDKLHPILRKAANNNNFYNVSNFTLQALLNDAPNIDINFRMYINGFSQEIQEIFHYFQLEKIVQKLNRHGLLYRLIEEICKLDLSPETVDNHDMGSFFEEIIRLANENSNETAGEHFTPRDVIRLMSTIMFMPDKEQLTKEGIIRTIYDPTCGTGGMVNIGRDFILEQVCQGSAKPTIKTYGQELNEVAFAIAKSEALITGSDADNIRLGNTLTQDRFEGKRFHYMMANPPYGITWKVEQDYVLNESLNPNGRFTVGTPRVSDGQLLFLQHMISKMDSLGSKIGVVTNGSPLFSGGAGSGESNIRRWIIENDWLDCIIALPKDLFYNTGIATYIWILTNQKTEQRRGKVQLIDATSFCYPAKKSLGNKRNDIREKEDIQRILQIYLDYQENEYSKIYPNQFFGSYELTIEQPQRKNGKLVLKAGKVQADSKKRDTEVVPLNCDIQEYFTKEVLPNIDPESWIDYAKTKMAYSINFTSYFHKEEATESADVIRFRIMEEKDPKTGLTRQEMIQQLLNSIFED